MLDWAALLHEINPVATQAVATTTNVATNSDSQAIDIKRETRGCSHVATVVTIFEANSADPDRKSIPRPGGDGVRQESATVIDMEAFEERAAIREFEAGMSRAEAERMARLDLTGRLSEMTGPLKGHPWHGCVEPHRRSSG